VSDLGDGTDVADAAEGWERESPWRRVALIVGVVLVLALIASTDMLHAPLQRLTDATAPLMRAHPVAGAAAFVLWSALSAMLAFFSSAVLVPVAVQVWGATGTTLLLWLGWTLGGVGAYTVARVAGRPLVRRLLKANVLARYEHRVSTQAPIGLVILLQLGLPSEIPGYLLGLVRYAPWRYVLALVIAELPWAVLTVLLGTTLMERRATVLLAVGAVAAALGGAALLALRARWRRAGAEAVL
jgi:uncharacterized membrane protein YdjX (TVP38/TMEM64 family)